jgi:hypothetical protein
MKRIGHISIVIDKKPFGLYKVISRRAFNDDLVTQVTFVNQSFIWIPSWPEIGAVIEALFTAENINCVNRGRRELSFFEAS